MSPAETGAHYDAIAGWWCENVGAAYGLEALERALRFTAGGGAALDVGCGSEGRFLARLAERGFLVEGMDISPNMVALARECFPQATFHTADICEWDLPRTYDFICAWDSIFHLPLDRHEPVLCKLCAGLAAEGALLFTCGGGEPGTIEGAFAGQKFAYSTLGVEAFVRILHDCGCYCRHVEYDQFPEKHVVVIAQKA